MRNPPSSGPLAGNLARRRGLARKVQEVLDAADALDSADALLERLEKARLLHLAAQEDDAVLGVDVDLPLGDGAVAEEDRLDLVRERGVVELGRPARQRVEGALDPAGGLRVHVPREALATVASPFGEREPPVARRVPPPAPVPRVEEVGCGRAQGAREKGEEGGGTCEAAHAAAGASLTSPRGTSRTAAETGLEDGDRRPG